MSPKQKLKSWPVKTEEKDHPLVVMRRRADLHRALRDFFSQADFIEAETPTLIQANAPEPHIDALMVKASTPNDDDKRPTLYVRTSPELALKALLAAGAERIFEFAHVARDEDENSAHRVEFSLLEWYRAGQPYAALMDDLDNVLAHCVQYLQLDPVCQLGEKTCRLDQGCERLSVSEAFARYAHIQLDTLLDDQRNGRLLALAALEQNIALPPSLRDDDNPDFPEVFFAIFLTAIEPHLGLERPTIVYAWPASMAALARRDPADSRLALRFELYAAGLELANAFDELVDVEEQRARFVQARAERLALGADPYPMPEAFLQRLAKMPPSAGIALGFERLLMLLYGLDDIAAAAIPMLNMNAALKN